jgi:hypothetical protein
MFYGLRWILCSSLTHILYGFTAYCTFKQPQDAHYARLWILILFVEGLVHCAPAVSSLVPLLPEIRLLGIAWLMSLPVETIDSLLEGLRWRLDRSGVLRLFFVSSSAGGERTSVRFHPFCVFALRLTVVALCWLLRRASSLLIASEALPAGSACPLQSGAVPPSAVQSLHCALTKFQRGLHTNRWGLAGGGSSGALSEDP